MSQQEATGRRTASPGVIRVLALSWEISLEAANKSPRTVRTYLESLRLFDDHLEGRGMPQEAAKIRREHVEDFIAEILRRWKPATASNRFRGLQQFFRWCEEEGEVETSPMARMTPPKVPEDPPPVLTDEQLMKLLKACEGTTFADRRDAAVIRLFIDTGMRRAELTGLEVHDINLRLRVAVVTGKGGARRACPFGRRTARALDRYLRARAKNREADCDALWLGLGGPMTDSGIVQVVRRRAKLAGIDERVNLHRFRHTQAHCWLLEGGQGEDLMVLAGWRSRSMLSRYGASAAATRAQEAHRRLALGDQL